MKSNIVIAACAALCVAAPATAATPILSGGYIVTERDFCQPVGTFHFVNVSTNNLVDSVTLTGGQMKFTLFQANFSPSKGKITTTGFGDGGDPIFFKTTGAQTSSQGQALGEDSQSGKVSYSNTDTTFTVDGTTFHAFYGQIDKNGIAHTFALQGMYQADNGQPCAEQAEATRQ
jgi:hypothetical protein